MNRYDWEYTDTFGGDANYSWVRRGTVRMPELTHYGYTGSTDGSYSRASRIADRETLKAAKAAAGITGMRGVTTRHGDMIEFRPYKSATVLFVTFNDLDD